MNQDVNNPFGYARQLTQDKDGNRRVDVLFPRTTPKLLPGGREKMLDSVHLLLPLGSLPANIPTIPEFQKQLRSFATNQLNWILGLNPFDSSMMNGVGPQ